MRGGFIVGKNSEFSARSKMLASASGRSISDHDTEAVTQRLSKRMVSALAWFLIPRAVRRVAGGKDVHLSWN